MTSTFHTPIAVGANNHPNTVNAPIGQLDAALVNLTATVANSTAALQDQIDDLIVESGTSDAETIAARTRIRYLVGSPPAVLGDTVEHVGRNQIYVDAYGAVGDGDGEGGGTDDTLAIQAALDAAVVGDVVIFGAGKIYYITATLLIDTANVTLLGYGATLDASQFDNDVGLDTDPVSDSNAAIKSLDVNRISVIGLSIIGPDITGSLNALVESGNTTGILLVNGDHCKVRDCHITGFFRGAIVVTTGDYASIIGNHIDRNRYRPAEMGSIFLSATKNSTVTGNVITGVWGAGVGAQNSDRCTISGNTIEGIDWSVETEAESMGIVGYDCDYFSVTGNIIRRITDEGIVFTGSSSYNTVTGNNIYNCHLYGVAFYCTGGTGGSPATARNNLASGNTIIVDATMPNSDDMDIALFIKANTTDDTLTDIAFIGNMVYNNGNVLSKGFGTSGVNLSFLTVINNVIRGANTGIHIVGFHALVANNACHDGNRGIIVASGTNEGMICGNLLIDSAVNSIQLAGGTLTRTQIINNMMSTAIDNDATGTAFWIEGNARSDIAMRGTATLTGGVATVTAAAVTAANSEGVVALYRRTNATDPNDNGMLAVGEVDAVNGDFGIKSNDAQDNGTVWWKVIR